MDELTTFLLLKKNQFLSSAEFALSVLIVVIFLSFFFFFFFCEDNLRRFGVRSAMSAASQLSGRGPTDVDVAPVPAY